MNLREAAQMALEALEWAWDGNALTGKEMVAIAALRAALAEPQTTHWEGCEEVHPECRKPEPRQWRNAALRVGEDLSSVGPDGYYDMTAAQWLDWAMAQEPRGKNSLTAPTPRKPLTDEEIGKIAGDTLDPWSCARAIEKAHGIGEQT